MYNIKIATHFLTLVEEFKIIFYFLPHLFAYVGVGFTFFFLSQSTNELHLNVENDWNEISEFWFYATDCIVSRKRVSLQALVYCGKSKCFVGFVK